MKTLSDLYPRNTRLSEIHPDFYGMLPERWLYLQAEQQAERYRRSLSPQEVCRLVNQFNDNHSVKGARDEYGTKGNIANRVKVSERINLLENSRTTEIDQRT